MSNKEIWKLTKYPGYKVSNRGNIIGPTGKILKCSYNPKGYKQIFRKDFFASIHQLVAIAFVPNPENLQEVNHIDGDRANNDSTNLEWCTRSQNCLHKYMGKRRGVTKAGKGFQVEMCIDGKRYYLGFFKEKEKAYQCFYNTYLDFYGIAPWEEQ